MPDLQRRDAGVVCVARLQGSDMFTAFVAQLAKLV